MLAHTVLSDDLINYRRQSACPIFEHFVLAQVTFSQDDDAKPSGTVVHRLYVYSYYIDTRHVYESESMFIQSPTESLKINFQPLLFSVAFRLERSWTLQLQLRDEVSYFTNRKAVAVYT